MAKYRMYVVSKKYWDDCEIVKKGIVNVRQNSHIYNLHGVSSKGHKACSNVAKEVWDRFDVPVVEHKVKRDIPRNSLENEMDLRKRKTKQKISKDRRKIENDDIERWLAEKYDMSLEIKPTIGKEYLEENNFVKDGDDEN